VQLDATARPARLPVIAVEKSDASYTGGLADDWRERLILCPRAGLTPNPNPRMPDPAA